jgi:hypothetical protein
VLKFLTSLIVLQTSLLLLVTSSVSAQNQADKKWFDGRYYDLKGNKSNGLIASHTGGDYIWFKKSDKDVEVKIKAVDISSFVAANDSFVVSHAVMMKQSPFLEVIIDEPVKLYQLKQLTDQSIVIMVPAAGNTPAQMTTVMQVGSEEKLLSINYFYGRDPDNLTQLKRSHFGDAIAQILAAKPALLDEVKYQQFEYKDIDQVIDYYNWAKRHENTSKPKGK